ncbi:MAG: CinA family nicotinamide mononucleotide deamidase-related protein [Flavobacteriales bacterium]|jgi:nicotinamide-nucleotide amidase|nr:CinA family nicotinamide mononucleotide deamidase-related protein [Flavobacteriales bacterium]
MKASIITIGDELLIGQVIDTNSSYIGKNLNDLGFYIQEKRAIADKEADIIEAIESTAKHSDLCIVTGGLGPTKDDITKKTICKIWDDKLESKKDLETYLKSWYEARGLDFSFARQEQAWVPTKCQYFQNPVGTASAMILEKDNCQFVFLPGVPSELYAFFDHYLLDFFKKLEHEQKVAHRYLITHGMPESEIANILSDIENELPEEISLAYLPNFRTVRLRLTAVYKDQKIAERLEYYFTEIKKRLTDISLYEGDLTPEMYLSKTLKKQNLTFASAESCTAGRIASAMTSMSGSSSYFMGSVLSYDNKVKKKLLGVKQSTLDQVGAVSEETVIQMAKGVAELMQTDIAISTSGIAGPTGGSEEKPVGTTWFGIYINGRIFTKKVRFRSNRGRNLEQATKEAIILLIKYLKEQ